MQIVGVYLVFASLIIPALASPKALPRAYAVGISGYALGLLASALLDLPSGATIMLALLVTLIVSALFRGAKSSVLH